MRRTLIALPDNDLDALDTLSGTLHVSRSELIRQAVTAFLEKSKPARNADEAFGLWKAKNVDGLEYQERLGAEW